MALAVTINEQQDLGKGFLVFFSLVFSGSYPGSNGEPVNWKTAGVKGTSKAATRVIATGKGGFTYPYDRANSTFEVRVNDAGGANAPSGEHTTAAYAAGVTGDVVEGIAFFPKFG